MVRRVGSGEDAMEKSNFSTQTKQIETRANSCHESLASPQRQQAHTHTDIELLSKGDIGEFVHDAQKCEHQNRGELD